MRVDDKRTADLTAQVASAQKRGIDGIMISVRTLADLLADRAEVADTLQRIAEILDPNDPNSYRGDDRDGAMDTAFIIAKEACDASRAKKGHSCN